MSEGALEGLQVIDFGQYVAGPLVAQMFADHGADVIRVDPPGGPSWRSDANAILQRGKRSIVLDLQHEEDLGIARSLVRSADVVVENFRPGVMERLGLGPDATRADNPGLIYLSLPGFATDDPRAGIYAHEGVVSAAAGLYPARDFDPDGEPVVNTLPLASVFAAMIGANSVVAALMARERSGQGQRIEVSLFDAAFEMTRFYADRTGPEPRYPAHIMLGGNYEPPTAEHYRCADGRWVHLSWLEGRQLDDFARLVGTYDEWAAEGLFDMPVSRYWSDPALAPKVRGLLEPIFLTRTAAEWERVANPACDLTECCTSEEWLLFDEQARTLDTAITLVDPELGVTHQVGHALTMTGTPPHVRRPRQLLDASRAEILAGLDNRRALRPEPASPMPRGSLDGITVIDTCQLLAGPTVGRILAEYGADVIHVSHPAGRASLEYHGTTNGGKQTISLDLKKPGGLEVFWELVERADVLSTNFSDSVAARLGVDEAAVRGRRPDIVYSRLSAHGPKGPRADYRGHEQVGQTVTGMQNRYGQDHTHPVMQPFAINDVGSGHMTALGILLALYDRARTGRGQWVGSSLTQVAALYQTPYMITHRKRTWDDPGGIGCKGTSPTERVYRAADGWFFLGAPDTEATHAALARIEGLSDVDTADELTRELVERFATEKRALWIERLVAAGLGAHAWNSIADAMDDAWARDHGLSVDVEFPGGQFGHLVGPAPRLSATPMRMGEPAHPVGFDTEAVLRELGLADRIEQLVETGTIHISGS
ncbi:CaiB/BaiF CoA transferase family protein [Rhodococcus qingshengii]|uniref:CaiB/BaiF CoA transferase family protein n=1 Tax=Rhodococcus qingshengii TaxID=334542 RepID=UPI001BE53B97|nr:CoA transferase [Rhodococcus qingshengii]MBT2273345.1 CoA transferase [Rhodococcus qingshengii]